MVELVEVFKDVKLFYESKATSTDGKRVYVRRYEIIPVQPYEPLTVERLKEYAQKLEKEHSEYKFYVDEVIVKGKKYYTILRSQMPVYVEEAQKSFFRLEDELKLEEDRLHKIEEKIRRLDDEVKAISRLSIFKRLFKVLRLRALKRELQKLETEFEGQKKAVEGYRVKVEEERKKLERLEAEAEAKNLPWLPIYFDIDEKKIFIDLELFEKNDRLYTFTLHRCLGWLGLAKNVYRGYVHE
jgi:HPt (histidine-containing phosphotransfer) domain-containing protein